MIKFIKRHINSFLWALIILILCGAPSSEFPSVGFLNIPHLDKIVHFGLYVVFTMLLLSETNAKRKKGELEIKSVFISLTIAIFYGLLIELMQMLVFKSRGAEFWDFVANTVGAIVAVLSYRLVSKITNHII
ncbi:MAG: VanZ family protein [Bacteroidales bacterium]|nr:MAG: VanZ family protein [Bacteroidales bacterium]